MYIEHSKNATLTKLPSKGVLILLKLSFSFYLGEKKPSMPQTPNRYLLSVMREITKTPFLLIVELYRSCSDFYSFLFFSKIFASFKALDWFYSNRVNCKEIQVLILILFKCSGGCIAKISYILISTRHYSRYSSHLSDILWVYSPQKIDKNFFSIRIYAN